ncbi:MAG TPA: sigma-54-dependent Fis family transcriptional regulator [Rhodocyclaceae bacterium]|nr:sigma-54-dependent Fis family transcriptional regulator [Rhodocyclaceae bacterium]
MGEMQRAFDARMLRARRAFFEDGTRPSGVIPDAVLRSWERSRQQGLGVRDRRIFMPVSREEVGRLQAESSELMACALPEMERLQAALGRGGWGIVCTDAQARVLKAVYGRSTAFREMDRIFEIGRNLSESAIGTNGPGCALIEGRPLTVRAAEHFLDETRPFTCASVPLFGPDGRIVGVLDATRYCDGAAPTVVEPLAIAARAVENRLLGRLGAALKIAFHCREDMLGTPMEGVLVFDGDGVLRGANQAARQLLSLTAGDDGGVRFDSVFDCPPETFGRCLGGRVERTVLWGGEGMRFELRVEAAQPRPVLARPASVPSRAGSGWASAPSAACTRDDGEDAAVARALHVAQRAFERDIPVLVLGETGTGKEVLARRLHGDSARADGPFVAINCSSLPAGLIESEFFGYEDGAFTGGRRGGAPGKFELAQGGTLFLDEIGDMPLELQGRLLRVLQERNFSRLGGARLIHFDARIVAATHRKLDEAVAAGAFREDLYYRIKGVRVRLPALRERADRAALIDTLLRRECGGRRPPPLSAEVRAVLLGYRWPGNLRQLGHVLRLALTLAEDDGEIGLQHLPEELLEAGSPTGGGLAPGLREQCLREVELDAVRAAMARCGGNVSAAARSLGVARATLYRKLRMLGMVGEGEA